MSDSLHILVIPNWSTCYDHFKVIHRKNGCFRVGSLCYRPCHVPDHGTEWGALSCIELVFWFGEFCSSIMGLHSHLGISVFLWIHTGIFCFRLSIFLWSFFSPLSSVFYASISQFSGLLIVKPTHAHFQFLFIKIYLKFLKTLLHVSVIRPSSASF